MILKIQNDQNDRMQARRPGKGHADNDADNYKITGDPPCLHHITDNFRRQGTRNPNPKHRRCDKCDRFVSQSRQIDKNTPDQRERAASPARDPLHLYRRPDNRKRRANDAQCNRDGKPDNLMGAHDQNNQ